MITVATLGQNLLRQYVKPEKKKIKKTSRFGVKLISVKLPGARHKRRKKALGLKFIIRF